MKKLRKTPLLLQTETVRTLTTIQLTKVDGGIVGSLRRGDTDSSTCTGSSCG